VFSSTPVRTPLNALPENSDEELSLPHIPLSQPPAAGDAGDLKGTAGDPKGTAEDLKGTAGDLKGTAGDLKGTAGDQEGTDELNCRVRSPVLMEKQSVTKSGSCKAERSSECDEVDRANTPEFEAKKSKPDILDNSDELRCGSNESLSVSDIGKSRMFSENSSFVSTASEFSKVYEPLKSVQLLRDMRQNLSVYLPKHSAGSDSEGE